MSTPSAASPDNLHHGDTWEPNLDTDAGIREAISILGEPLVRSMLESKASPTKNVVVTAIDTERKTITLGAKP